jgi:hypothetical protein
MNVAWPHGDPREVVHRILAGARFRRAPQGPAEMTWQDYLLAALRALWHRLTDPLRALTGNSRLTTIIGIVVLIAVLVALTIVIARFVTSGAAVALGTDADARALFARALDAAAAGRHHEAAALLWASALRALDERGRVRYDPARTPGEWRRAVRDPSFDALARDAVVALFGDRGADAALVARMREAYDRVVAPA